MRVLRVNAGAVPAHSGDGRILSSIANSTDAAVVSGWNSRWVLTAVRGTDHLLRSPRASFDSIRGWSVPVCGEGAVCIRDGISSVSPL
jgi:hypothetical protein